MSRKSVQSRGVRDDEHDASPAHAVPLVIGVDPWTDVKLNAPIYDSLREHTLRLEAQIK